MLGFVAGALALATAGGLVTRRSRSSRAARAAATGSALLASSVLADSAIEHYRGNYRRRAMFAAPGAALLTLAAAIATRREARSARWEGAAYAGAVATGIVGTGFHARTILRRPGGLSLNNLFYQAPFGAPGALALAGGAGLAAIAAQRVSTFDARRDAAHDAKPEAAQPVMDRRLRTARGVAALAASGLAGLTAEIGLLHFRGAFHDPLMYLPVAAVPVTGAALLAAVAAPRRRLRRRLAARALTVTAVLGVAGLALHAWGVGRNMGGFHNWTQNLFAGPPIAAPPSLAGIAALGFAALDLLDVGTGAGAVGSEARESGVGR